MPATIVTAKNLVDEQMLVDNILRDSKSYTDQYNLVSITGGKYYVDKATFLDAYDRERTQNQVMPYNIAERVDKTLTQVRCDIDSKVEVSPCTKPYALVNDETVLEIIKAYFHAFSEFGLDFTEDDFLCVVLRKPPRIKTEVKGGKTIHWLKHGLHLQFPRVYLPYEHNKKLSKYIENQFPDLVDYQAGFCNAWLLYGSCKDAQAGTYEASNYVYSDLQMVPFHYDGNITRYLSIGNFRDNPHWKNVIIPDNVKAPQCATEAVVHNRGSVEDMVVDWLDREGLSDSLTVGDWNPVKRYLRLNKTSDYLCPCNPDYLHTNRGASVYVSDTGGVFYKCYRPECRAVRNNICIGVCQECAVEDIVVQHDLDLECNEAYKTYQQNPDGKLAKYNGMTYGDIAQQDNRIAHWFCDNNIIPHDYYFCKVLKREYVEKPIGLDPIKPDRVIDTDNIGTYDFDGVDTIFLRSNMMTHKTQSLKTIIDNYDSVVYISFRRSLSNEMSSQFSDYGFAHYEDVEGFIRDKRVIVQVDSLHRLRGKYELVILDEAVYTLNHLISFCREKPVITETLQGLYQSCRHTIVCDALLDTKTIKYITSLDPNRRSQIIENTYKPFKHKKTLTCHVSIHEHNKVLLHIERQITEHRKLYIPTNSQRFGEKVFDYFRDTYRVLLIDKNTEHIPHSSTWRDYDMVVCSPTIGAGVSCNDEFGKTVCYFTNNSCNAELSAQMILRVRNTRCDTIDMFVCETFRSCLPTNTAAIKDMVKTKYSMDLSLGLKVDRVEDKVVENDYHDLFVEYIRSENISKVAFRRKLDGILLAHGFEVGEFSFVEETQQRCSEVKQTIKDQKDKRDDESTMCMLESLDIDSEEYERISKKQRKTKDDRSKLEKYNLVAAYGEDGFAKIVENNCLRTTRALVKDIYKYRNLTLLKNKDIENAVRNLVAHAEGIERLHDNKKACKIWVAYRIIELLGFDSVFDTSQKSSLDYGLLLDWLKEWNYRVRTLWDESDREDFSSYDISDRECKTNILKRYNTILNKVLGVTVKDSNRKHSSRDGNHRYRIYGLDRYDLVGGVKEVVSKRPTSVSEVMDLRCANDMMSCFVDEDDILYVNPVC